MSESQHIRQGEQGQTSAEYVAVTAVAVSLALGLIYLVLEAALVSAVGHIANAIADFVTSNV